MNQNGSAKETVSPKIENIEMLVSFICMVAQQRSLIDIKVHHHIFFISLDRGT